MIWSDILAVAVLAVMGIIAWRTSPPNLKDGQSRRLDRW